MCSQVNAEGTYWKVCITVSITSTTGLSALLVVQDTTGTPVIIVPLNSINDSQSANVICLVSYHSREAISHKGKQSTGLIVA